jgi:CRP-like cAMP-binding protein
MDFLEEIHDVVDALTLFEGFTSQELTVMCSYMECYAALSGITLFKEGNSGDFLIIVLTGKVNVVKTDTAGIDKVVCTVGPGSFLGEMSLIDGNARFASCATTEPTDVAVLTRDDLTGMMADHPQLGSKILLLLLQLVTIRLRDATTRMLPTLGGEIV